MAIALLTFGSASLVTTTAGQSSGGDKGRVVAANSEGKIRSSVTGTAENGRDIKAGKFTPDSFDADGDSMTVTGTVEGVIPGEGKFSETVTAPVESINGTPVSEIGSEGEAMQLASSHGCDILNLVLGPLDLNVLGLEVHLDTVVLDIIAVPGAGNLLGNLLCAVAGLLNPTSPLEGLLTQLTGLLNQILGALGR
jgi:hypothetical protein